MRDAEVAVILGAESGPDTADLLAQVPLFRNLRGNHLAALAAAAVNRRVAPGETISVAGRPAPGLIVLRRGRAERAGLTIGPGEHLDVLEALDVRQASETMTALEEVDCIVLPARALHDAVRADPELGVALLREASRQFVPAGDEDTGQLLRYANDLRDAFREGERRQAALRRSVIGAVRALTNLLEARDPSAAGHAARSARLARALADAIGHDTEQQNDAALGGLLHDVGFLVVDPALQRKSGPLGEAEQAQIRSHAEIGARIVSNIESLSAVVPFVLHHHERFDGLGYPAGLIGRSIPIEGRLMAAVEVAEEVRAAEPPGPERMSSVARAVRARAGLELDADMAHALADLLGSGAFGDG